MIQPEAHSSALSALHWFVESSSRPSGDHQSDASVIEHER